MVRFKIGSISVGASFWFFALFALLIAAGTDVVALLAAVAVHETGHLLPLLLFGGRVGNITLSAGGIVIQPASSRMTGNSEDAVILLMGPLFGLIAALLAHLLGKNEFALLNLGLSLFNLLPLRGLDGHSLLLCWRLAAKRKRSRFFGKGFEKKR